MFNTMKFRESAGIGIQVNKAIREITSAGREEQIVVMDRPGSEAVLFTETGQRAMTGRVRRIYR